MSTENGPGSSGAEDDGARTGSRDEWWATLADDALADETRANVRSERWLLVAAPIALVVTVLALLAHGGVPT